MANQLQLPLQRSLWRDQYFTVYGGPYRQRTPGTRGVKMAVEIKEPCDVDCPTVDFAVPERKMFYRALHQTVDLLLAGEPLYVGCMGGVGRTGLMLAVLAKAFGVKRPVEYVRKHYNGHAVETPEQKKFVAQLTITPSIRRKLKALRRKMFWKFWKTNLTRLPVVATEPVKGKDELSQHLDSMYSSKKS